MSYAVLLAPRARREFSGLPKEIIARIDSRLINLGVEPRPLGCKKLKASTGDGWRIRIGDYRVLYRIDDQARTVLVFRIGHRRNVYE